jgi:hypothetical protein
MGRGAMVGRSKNMRLSTCITASCIKKSRGAGRGPVWCSAIVRQSGWPVRRSVMRGEYRAHRVCACTPATVLRPSSGLRGACSGVRAAWRALDMRCSKRALARPAVFRVPVGDPQVINACVGVSELAAVVDVLAVGDIDEFLALRAAGSEAG